MMSGLDKAIDKLLADPVAEFAAHHNHFTAAERACADQNSAYCREVLNLLLERAYARRTAVQRTDRSIVTGMDVANILVVLAPEDEDLIRVLPIMLVSLAVEQLVDQGNV